MIASSTPLKDKKHNLCSETINNDTFNIMHPIITNMISKVCDKARFVAF